MNALVYKEAYRDPMTNVQKGIFQIFPRPLSLCPLISTQIMREIQEHKIKIYEFPETDDEEENKLVKKIKVCVFSPRRRIL